MSDKTTNASSKPGLSRAQLNELTRRLTKEGKLIEAGFSGLRAACIAADAPPEQLHEMRLAFFAGAQHLFVSIMSVLDPGSEPTDADMERMSNIDAELRAFSQDFELRHVPAGGRA